ncbi:Myotubularin- protein 2 [Schistosoma haematobium]|uniref:Myotubularin- protein 2 n=1 Tax=Schistosoma haematobium TaxID=6185 RepID=A0A922IT90_SCHHA|nr:Myotubularin- protein 2 [Schistosoma haematobium]KAH9587077.1 Myotubularin- protein 2 [Schistosoma haematobium]
MSAYSSLLSGHAYRKLPGEERVDHCSASHVTYGGLNLHGVIELTNFQVVFIALPNEASSARAPKSFHGSDKKRYILKLPLGTIRNIDQKSNQGNISLHIVCKDIRELVFAFPDCGRSLGFCENLKANAFPAISKKTLFAYLYGAKCIANSVFAIDGWDVYNPEEEYHRQNIFTNGWRITKINMDYRLCDTYPAILAVPWEVTDELLVACAPHRSRGRIPVLSWLHPESKASLTRASQPLVGVQGRRSSDDKELVRQLRIANANANNLLIFDARPQVNAIANMGVGGGVESPAYYENVQYMFLNIQNIHAMRAALTKVFEACFPLPDDTRWFKQLADSKWLYHIKQIIFAATSVADKIENHKTSVLIHCSDGWDRTTQVTSLAMLMLDPYYRTIRGFEVLVEKEWCSFGHKFAQRTGGPTDGGIYLPPNSSSSVVNETGGGRPSSPEERSPVFLQFIDCVWQTMQQFPHSFEFNERFLITIMDELYSARFGTFLFNSEMQGRDHGVRERTISLWAYINADIQLYQNPLYTPAEISGHRVIFPQHALAQLQFWTAYYIRWHPLMRLQEPIARRERALILIMKRFRELTAATQRECAKPTLNNVSDNSTHSRSRSNSSKI